MIYRRSHIKKPKQLAADQNGATAIEFALVLPVLITFIVGIIASGQAFFAVNNAQRAIQLAARQVMMNPSYTLNDIETFIAGQMTSLPVANISASYSIDTTGSYPLSRLQADISYPISLPLLPPMSFDFQVDNYIPLSPEN